MSRIGKKPIILADKVTLTVGADNVVTVKGPKGELHQAIDRDIKVEVKDNEVVLTRPTEQIRHRAMHGLYRALLNNMVVGVTTGYTVKQELVGVGYKATNDGNILDLTLGYSHHIYFQIPSELKVKN